MPPRPEREGHPAAAAAAMLPGRSPKLALPVWVAAARRLPLGAWSSLPAAQTPGSPVCIVSSGHKFKRQSAQGR